jgi:hypothetical protein
VSSARPESAGSTSSASRLSTTGLTGGLTPAIRSISAICRWHGEFTGRKGKLRVSEGLTQRSCHRSATPTADTTAETFELSGAIEGRSALLLNCLWVPRWMLIGEFGE